MQHPPEPHERPAPEPTISVEEFRAQYTIEIRQAVADCITVEQIRLAEFYERVEGLESNAAKAKASAAVKAARRGQQLIHALHPEAYQW
jgi:hypothetical protein